jgi:hypothetical protein
MYVFEMEKLQAGDIMLTAQAGLTSKAVRLSTNSKFSHAILYLGGGSFIHSDSQGVHSNNIQRLLFKNKGHAEVWRLNDNKFVSKAIMFARSQIGVSYSVKEAVKTKSPFYAGEKMNRQFCSRLVAQSFDYAGIKLVDNADYCTPEDLKRSPSTKMISDCLRIAEKHEIDFASSFNPLQRQTDITNSILESVRSLTQKDIQSFEDLDQFIIDNPTYDKKITDIVRLSGYLSMFDYELVHNPWRFDGEIFLSLDLDPSYKKERAEFELDSAEEQVRLYSHNYLMCQSIRGRFPLVYFEMKMELYKKLINFMNKRISAASYVIENT